MAEYISHIVGTISEQEYAIADKPFSDTWIKLFRSNRRVIPGILYIEKNYPNKKLIGKQIEEILISLGFSRNTSRNAMRVFSANKYVNQKLSEMGYDIEKLSYAKSYDERARIYFPIGTLLMDTRYASEDTIFVRPLKVPVIECSQFTIIDAFGGSQSRKPKESITHSINHRDLLNVLITPDQYDDALLKARKLVNDIIIGFFGIKNPNLGWENLEDLRHSKEYDTEYEKKCPENRTYEFDIVLSEDHMIEFSMKYSQGKEVPGSVIGNVPINRIIPILKSIGAWEK